MRRKQRGRRILDRKERKREKLDEELRVMSRSKGKKKLDDAQNFFFFFGFAFETARAFRAFSFTASPPMRSPSSASRP